MSKSTVLLFIALLSANKVSTWLIYTCPLDWVKENKRCYRYFNHRSTWEDAREACQYIGGDLVAILDETESDTVFGFWQSYNLGIYMYRKGFWIGLQTVYDDSAWGWVNGTTTKYDNWRNGEPSNLVDRMCAQVSTAGSDEEEMQKWSALPCNSRRKYMCEREQLAEYVRY